MSFSFIRGSLFRRLFPFNMVSCHRPFSNLHDGNLPIFLVGWFANFDKEKRLKSDNFFNYALQARPLPFCKPKF